MDSIATFINKLNETVGKLNGLLILPLVGVVMYEVVLRYLFNSPTSWGFELTVFLYGVHYMLGLGFTEGRGGHVAVDVLVNMLSERKRALVAIISSIVLFVPVWAVMTYAAINYAITSTAGLERNATSWGPPIWPFKILMAVGFVLLLLQGLATIIRHIETYRELGR